MKITHFTKIAKVFLTLQFPCNILRCVVNIYEQICLWHYIQSMPCPVNGRIVNTFNIEIHKLWFCLFFKFQIFQNCFLSKIDSDSTLIQIQIFNATLHKRKSFSMAKNERRVRLSHQYQGVNMYFFFKSTLNLTSQNISNIIFLMKSLNTF